MTTKICIKCKDKQDEICFHKTGRNLMRGNVCQKCKTKRQTELRIEKRKGVKKEKHQNQLIQKDFNTLISMKW